MNQSNTKSSSKPSSGRKRSRRRSQNKHGKRFRHSKGAKRDQRPKKSNGRPETNPRTLSDFDFLIPKKRESQKFFSDDDLQNKEFGFQNVQDEDSLEYRQIYKIMHGMEGDVEVPENKDDYAGMRGAIVHYCKDCEKIIEPTKHPKKQYLFRCSECKKDNVCWGTEAAIKSHFRIKD